jgi:metallo-beta-lactamase class B
MPRRLLLALALAAPVLMAQSSAKERAAWNRPVKPFRILGNVYYVGVEGVAVYLITTPEGAILLDGAFAESAPRIAKSVAALGFRVGDVKILLNTHAHYDHSGGLSALRKLSGGQMVASEADSGVLRSGRQAGNGGKDILFPPVRVDRTIRDGETVSLGGTVLTAHITPGHTPGCTTWSMPVSDHGKTFQVVFYCSTTVAGNQLVNNGGYPQIVADYERTFEVLRSLPCDVFLAPHPSFFHPFEKEKALAAGRWDAFVDPSELRRVIDDSRKEFEEELAKQQRLQDNR